MSREASWARNWWRDLPFWEHKYNESKGLRLNMVPPAHGGPSPGLGFVLRIDREIMRHAYTYSFAAVHGISYFACGFIDLIVQYSKILEDSIYSGTINCTNSITGCSLIYAGVCLNFISNDPDHRENGPVQASAPAWCTLKGAGHILTAKLSKPHAAWLSSHGRCAGRGIRSGQTCAVGSSPENGGAGLETSNAFKCQINHKLYKLWFSLV